MRKRLFQGERVNYVMLLRVQDDSMGGTIRFDSPEVTVMGA